MILGLGIDLFPIARLERELERWGTGFLEEFLSPTEQLHARKDSWSQGRLAATFAGKEAIFKALGTGRTKGMRWQEIEVLPSQAGRIPPVPRGETAPRSRNRPLVDVPPVYDVFPVCDVFAVYVAPAAGSEFRRRQCSGDRSRPSDAPGHAREIGSSEIAPCPYEIRLQSTVRQTADRIGISRLTLALEVSGGHAIATAVAIAESGVPPEETPFSGFAPALARPAPLSKKGGLE